MKKIEDEPECTGALICSNLLGPIQNLKAVLNEMETIITTHCKKIGD